MKTARIILAACLAAGLPVGAAKADDDAALNRLRDQVRQAVTEKRQLEDENFQLKAQLAAAQAEAAKVKAAPPAPKVSPELLKLREETVRQNDQRVELQAQIEILGADLAKTRADLTQATAVLRELQAVRMQQSGQLQASALREKACIDHNGQLTALNRELLDRYVQQGFWETLREHETVTGLYRVALENLEQDYRNRIRDANAAPAPEASPSSPGAEPVNPASAQRAPLRPSGNASAPVRPLNPASAARSPHGPLQAENT